MQPDDLSLVKRSREGDRNAFRMLVERYQRKAYVQALGMLRNREEAMDVAQDAFVKVYKYLNAFKGESSFSTWLYRIVSNLSVDRLRKRATQRLHELGDAETHSIDNVEFDEVAAEGILSTRLGTDPQQTLMRSELGKKMEEALAQLSEKHREILILRELEGKSYEDLARILEVPKGTVMSRLFHARAKMQSLLADYVGDGTRAMP